MIILPMCIIAFILHVMQQKTETPMRYHLRGMATHFQFSENVSECDILDDYLCHIVI